MLEIYLVRHGRTLFNQKDRVQGACDSPLTKEGRLQAENVGRRMKDIPFTLAFSSPSERASDTCEAIIQNRLPILLDKRLKEMNFGYLEGDMNSDLKKGKPSDIREMCKVGWVEEGGENQAMVTHRISDFFLELVSKYDHEVVLIASHGMWIHFAIEYLLNREEFVPVENCSVTKLIYQEGKFKAEYINNTTFRDGGI